MDDISDLLIFSAFLLLFLELFVASNGVFAGIGILAFLIGSFLLYYAAPVMPYMFLYIILPAFAVLSALVFVLIVLGYKSQKEKLKMGRYILVGEIAICRQTIEQNKAGQVEINGELWSAYSDFDIKVGEKVKIVKQDTLKLIVEPLKRRVNNYDR